MKTYAKLMLAAWCCLWSCVALALPDDHLVTYTIRVDPSDEQSDPDFEVQFTVKAVSSEDDWVKWEVSKIQILDVDAQGATVESWTKSSPTINTSDGFWWVEHDDIDNPESDEFGDIPDLVGTADVDGTGDDLDYDIAPGSLTRTEAAMYSGNVAGMTYDFTKVNESTPIAEGEDEPEEADGEAIPPA